MAVKSSAFHTRKIPLNGGAFPSDSHDKIESLFFAYEAAKTDAVAERRKAKVAGALATQREQQVLLQLLTLLSTASEYEPSIGSEELWVVFRGKDGVITFEGITESQLRNNFRASQKMLGDQVREHSSPDDSDIFEEGEGD